MTDNPRWSNRRCPGVPGLVEDCTRKLRTRKLCPDCEKTAETGKVLTKKCCSGVPAIGHTCTMRVWSRSRCSACEKLYRRSLANMEEVKRSSIKRKCLRCDKEYTTISKFLRLCKSCRGTNASSELSGLSSQNYSLNITRTRGGSS